MKLLSTFVLGVFCFVSHASQIKMAACPGEGPHPFSLQDISSEISTPTKLKTNGSVRDFTVSETRSALYYRNEDNEVYQMNLKSQENKFLHNSSYPLSKLMDPAGRLLMTERFNFVLDVFYANYGWKYLGSPQNDSIRPLYWQKLKGEDVLFEIANWRDRVTGKQNLTVYSFARGRWWANSCNLKDVPGTLKLGEGHFYPSVFLYESASQGDETKLRLWNIRIDGFIFRCVPSVAYSYVHKIPGQIRSVSQFAGSKMFAVRTTDKEKNLIWTNKADNKGCRYLNFEGSESFVLNNRQPVIGVSNPRDGFTLVYPNEQKMATIVPGLPISKDQVWMDSKGKSIITGISLSTREAQELYELKLKKD